MSTMIAITWRGRTLEADRRISFTVDSLSTSNRAVLEMLYRNTNLYEGPLWDVIEPLLPADRSHTAISVGDLVEIDGSAYLCEPVGWSCIAGPAAPSLL